jgi:glycerophosphoryl diester phosphodiesterase
MRLIGHRGARFEAPENTLPGFRYALGIGIDSFELDIHLTKDSELVVIHDATVDRTTNGSGAVADLSLEEIQRLDARSNFADWPEPCAVPAFSQVLETLNAASYIEVEIKTDLPERLDVVVPKAAAMIEAHGMAERTFFTSFDPYALAVAQRIAPAIRRGFIAKWDVDACRIEAERLEVSLAGFPYATGSTDLVRWAKAAGILITGWPTNSQESLDKAIEWGVDAICTDAPTEIRRLLTQQGEAGQAD